MANLFKNIAKLIYNGPHVRLYSSSGFSSAISLSKLYPNTNLKLTTPQPPITTNNTFSGYIPVDELAITYSRSTGPGGQNVNRVNTKVEVRFHVATASWINEQIKNKLSEKHKNKLTKEGYIIFRSDLTRSQHLNLADCLEKIRATIRSCEQEEHVPSVETEERIRRRLEKETRMRLAIKRERSKIKEDRRAPDVSM